MIKFSKVFSISNPNGNIISRVSHSTLARTAIVTNTKNKCYKKKKNLNTVDGNIN